MGEEQKGFNLALLDLPVEEDARARAFAAMDSEESAAALAQNSVEQKGAVASSLILVKMDRVSAARILEDMDVEPAARIVSHMDSDAAAQILAKMKTEDGLWAAVLMQELSTVDPAVMGHPILGAMEHSVAAKILERMDPEVSAWYLETMDMESHEVEWGAKLLAKMEDWCVPAKILTEMQEVKEAAALLQRMGIRRAACILTEMVQEAEKTDLEDVHSKPFEDAREAARLQFVEAIDLLHKQEEHQGQKEQKSARARYLESTDAAFRTFQEAVKAEAVKIGIGMWKAPGILSEMHEEFAAQVVAKMDTQAAAMLVAKLEGPVLSARLLAEMQPAVAGRILAEIERTLAENRGESFTCATCWWSWSENNDEQGNNSVFAAMDEIAAVQILSKMDKAWALPALERMCEGGKFGPPGCWIPPARLLAKVHRSIAAKILMGGGSLFARELVAAMDVKAAAEVVEEMEVEKANEFLGQMDTMGQDAGARILELMEPGTAALVLGRRFHGMVPGCSAKLFAKMSVKAAARVLEEMEVDAAVGILEQKSWRTEDNLPIAYAAQVLAELEEAKVARLLEKVMKQKRGWIIEALMEHGSIHTIEQVNRLVHQEEIRRQWKREWAAVAPILEGMETFGHAGARVIAEMEPLSAAGPLSEMKEELVAQILQSMEMKTAATVLGRMEIATIVRVLAKASGPEEQTNAASLLMELQVLEEEEEEYRYGLVVDVLEQMVVSCQDVAVGVLSKMEKLSAARFFHSWLIEEDANEVSFRPHPGLRSLFVLMEEEVAAGIFEELVQREHVAGWIMEHMQEGEQEHCAWAVRILAQMHGMTAVRLVEQMEQKSAARILVPDQEMDSATAAGIVGKMGDASAAEILSTMAAMEGPGGALGEAGMFPGRKAAAKVLLALETQKAADAIKGRSWILRSRIPRDARALIAKFLSGPATAARIISKMTTDDAAAIMANMKVAQPQIRMKKKAVRKSTFVHRMTSKALMKCERPEKCPSSKIMRKKEKGKKKRNMNPIKKDTFDKTLGKSENRLLRRRRMLAGLTATAGRQKNTDAKREHKVDEVQKYAIAARVLAQMQDETVTEILKKMEGTTAALLRTRCSRCP